MRADTGGGGGRDFLFFCNLLFGFFGYGFYSKANDGFDFDYVDLNY